MKESIINISSRRALLNVVFAGLGLGLFLWVLYLGNYAFFCNWHFEDSEARFLVLGDPQMEGDARIQRQGIYGQIDIMYNDAYFKHIVSSIMKYLSPTHVFVLGDLFSSQHLSDREFEIRLQRYSNIFESVKVPLYNITGNHDLGYAGEATVSRVKRFEKVFGKVNDDIVIADHLIGIVNSQNIDASFDEGLRQQTWGHIDKLKKTSEENNMPVIMMMHIPLHKETYEEKNFENTWTQGRKMELCTDRSYTTRTSHGHIDVQNMIQPESTQTILDTVKPAFVFNGHDHDGCIYRHNDKTVEYTIRSMMGEFGGYAGMFEIRRNPETDPQPFSYHYTPCPFVTTTTTTITFIVVVVFLFVVTSVNLYYATLPPYPVKSKFFELEQYEERDIEDLGYVKAKGA